MDLGFVWIVILIIGLLFLAEKTEYRIINFGSFGLTLYLAFQQDEPFLLGILVFVAFIILIYSIFGEK